MEGFLLSERKVPFSVRLRHPLEGSPQKCEDSIPADYWPSRALIAASIFSLTLLRLKEAGACIGGYSMAVSPSLVTTCWTKTNRQASRPKNSLNHAGAPCAKFRIGVRSNGSWRML